MKEEVKQEEKNEVYLENENLSKEPFLFVINIKNVDISFLCGCSLFCAIKFISIIMVLYGISGVLSSYQKNNYFDFILSFIYSTLYFISGFYLFKSSISFDYNSAEIGYKIYAILFLFDLFLFISNCFLIAFGISNALGEGHHFLKKYVFYLILGIFSFFIKLYFVWIAFSYMVHLKLNRIKVIMLAK
jgi:hypothetical protein